MQGATLADRTGSGSDAPDVLVVGGGLVGGMVALRLAEGGRRVLVVERTAPHSEASSAAAGLLAPQADSTIQDSLFELGLAGRALYPGLAEELLARTGIDVGHRTCGVIDVAFTDEELAGQQEKVRAQRAAGLAIEEVAGPTLRELEPEVTGSARGALYFPNEAQVDPRRLGRAVWSAAFAAGVGLRIGTARRLLIRGNAVRGVEVDRMELFAPAVVVAAGSWSGLVGEGLLPPGAVKPIRGQMVELEVLPLPLRHAVYGAGGYLVPRVDGRLLCGSTVESVGFHKQVTVGGVLSILGAAARLVPGLAQAPIRETWSGLRPRSHDEVPIVGAAPGVAGLWFATGHFRSGILLGPLTAAIVAALMLEKAPPCRPELFAALSPARLMVHREAT